MLSVRHARRSAVPLRRRFATIHPLKTKTSLPLCSVSARWNHTESLGADDISREAKRRYTLVPVHDWHMPLGKMNSVLDSIHQPTEQPTAVNEKPDLTFLSPSELSEIKQATETLLRDLTAWNEACIEQKDRISLSSLGETKSATATHTGNSLHPNPFQTSLRGSSAWSNHHHENYYQSNPFSQQLSASFSNQSFKADDDTAPKVTPSRTLGTTRVPTPPSMPVEESNTSPEKILQSAGDLVTSTSVAVLKFLLKLPGNILYFLIHPGEARQKWLDMKQLIKDEIHHYWVGTKLLWADMRTARSLLLKTLHGSSLTRRERKQLLRTVSDLFRIIPFSMFIIIPLGELALPFALKVFPNLLPSTFQDSLKHEENMKRELQGRIAMAQFFGETLEELAKEQKRKASKRTQELEEAGTTSETIEKQEDTAASFLEFLENARSGQGIPPDVIIRYANYFRDDLTLDNMPRMQLINMCKYMGFAPYGSDSFLRFQLRHRMRVLKEDDQRILWEGIDSLTKMELREACQERGMRSTGLSKDAYKRALQEWLDLSVEKNVPISLLIMSRTFFLKEDVFKINTEEEDESSKLAGLADTISGLDKEVLNEVILEVATSEEKQSDPDVRKIKLEVLSKQNELIREEEEARDAAKKKEKKEKEKAEALAAEAEEEATEAPPETETVFVAETPAEKIPSETETETEEEPEPVEEEFDLSPHEMDAISQLVSEDPVSKERAELEKIKAAMMSEEDHSEVSQHDSVPVEEISAVVSDAAESKEVSPEPISSEEADQIAASMIEQQDAQLKQASEASTTISIDPEQPLAAQDPEDPVVARLKKRLESMVSKIETQLTETEVKIGDKLHFLDKDKDGVLSPEEMAEVLNRVLKREITLEDAMTIANEMDENRDGVFTVEELIQWIDEHKLEKFVEEGRDADMDRLLEKQASSEQQLDDNSQAQSEHSKTDV